MVIELFSGFSKKPNSTKQPSGGTSKTVTLKDGCSVLNPVFLINGYDLSHNYLKWGSRYYFIDDIVIVGNELAEYHCSTDVLATYKTGIGSSSQYVSRAASSYNGAIMDNKYPTKAKISSADEQLSSISSEIDISNGTVVLGIKSKLGETGVAYYALSGSELASFMDYLYSDQWMTATDISTQLQKMFCDPFDYIVSCMWYPFTIPSTPTSLYFGYFDWTGHSVGRISEANRLKSFLHAGTLDDHPQIARGSYLNAYPFTRLELNCYAFGKIVLDPNRFLNSRSFAVALAIDVFTGIGTLKVESTTGIIYEASASCGVPIQLSQVKNDLTRPVVSLAGAAVAATTENYVGAAGAIADAVHSAMPQISSIGAVGSISAYSYNVPRIRQIFYEIVDEDLAQIGRPLCEVRTISGLSGFIQCDNADLDLPASPSEKDMILNYMNGGFYYE